MNKTIKIIDLLNKMANGKEVPKKLIYYDIEFVYGAFTNENDFLEGLDGKSYNGGKSGYWSKEQNGWFEYYVDFDSLNETVEIIEDNDKLEKIKSLNNVGGSNDLGEFKDKQQLNNHILKDKINKIIGHINKIEEKLDEK